MKDSAVTRWWWVRHAPVIYKEGVIYGQLDVPCDTSDTDSFRALARTLPKDAVWVTSHLSRTKETAAAIAAQGLKTSKPIVEPDFAEQNMGDWQLKTWDELNVETDQLYRAFWHDPAHNAPPGGESFVDVINRVSAVIRRFNADYAGADIVAVAHGGTIRAAVAMALDLTPERALAVTTSNLALTRLDFTADEGEHVSYGIRVGKNGAWRVVGINMPSA
ncbi:MAG: hypothetical protein A3G18_01130 [Rhodospirillales bacterium RIFCSPLOWO2_12_FULL_58_28]|nr:MAG: hypothetical protein A3H92_04330 [Rhodospirillales bacterium RIFCSPLOWO2_02_FULL_58_16]OHC78006.1 MAG: hypothetical protein A3G18_01130 [Rhodospirillales bacterium RIFCSPLOWO2_12_FULL_58_28]